MKVYLSGPMTGIADWNFPAFQRATERWRMAGHTVLSPHEGTGGLLDKPREFHLRRDLKMLAGCDALVLLAGWEKSRGAVLEMLIAREIGLPIYEERSMMRVEPPLDCVLDVLLNCLQKESGQ